MQSKTYQDLSGNRLSLTTKKQRWLPLRSRLLEQRKFTRMLYSAAKGKMGNVIYLPKANTTMRCKNFIRFYNTAGQVHEDWQAMGV